MGFLGLESQHEYSMRTNAERQTNALEALAEASQRRPSQSGEDRVKARAAAIAQFAEQIRACSPRLSAAEVFAEAGRMVDDLDLKLNREHARPGLWSERYPQKTDHNGDRPLPGIRGAQGSGQPAVKPAPARIVSRDEFSSSSPSAARLPAGLPAPTQASSGLTAILAGACAAVGGARPLALAA